MQRNETTRSSRFHPDRVQSRLFEKIRPRLAFSPDNDIAEWKRELKEALARSLGDTPRTVALEPVWSDDQPIDGARVQRVEFNVEDDQTAVGWLALPDDGANVRPTITITPSKRSLGVRMRSSSNNEPSANAPTDGH